ncbi:PTS system cellobiose-specific IIC component [Lactobacillus colini]|uniref:Permease IIC component n=1 Tax=Lactobacillus colini TaxID=1819254 RepID=A0ABS4MGX9_9LACO|nr:PTS transporter subunit EIIC [Lactobacillus colini]MBP2058959.1 PTS system cellobiose-specific IIC component [Lactobacillus colini]
MNKLINWLSISFAPKAKKLFSHPWIAAVADSMQKMVPFILAGSLIFIYNVIKSYVSALPDLSNISNFTFGMLGLIVAFLVASSVMENLHHQAYIQVAGLTSIAVYLVNMTPKINEKNIMQIDFSRFGASGLFVAIVNGLFVAIIFHLWSKIHLLEDSSIPDFFVNWINDIFPILISVAIATVFVFSLKLDIFKIIQWLFSPLQGFGQTLPGFILLSLIPAFFYTLGISSWSFNAITMPIFMAGITANIAAVKTGHAPMNIDTYEVMFTSALITLGGMGATLPLNILMFTAKAKKLKILSKVCIFPSLFNINEPLMYSTPVVMNPLLMIPIWINAIIGPIVIWIVMRIGLLNIPSKMIQVGQVPAPISSVMVTQDWRAIICYIVLFTIYLLVWYPFFKVYDNSLVKESTEK